MRVSDRQSQREGRDPMPGGARGGPGSGLGAGLSVSPGDLRIFRHTKALFLGLGEELGRLTAPNLVPASCPSTANLPILRILLTVLLCSQ